MFSKQSLGVTESIGVGCVFSKQSLGVTKSIGAGYVLKC